MSYTVNRVFLIGNVGRKPELRRTQSGTAVVNFSIATTERWKTKDGQDQERTDWHRISAWGKLAEICDQFIDKGRQVFVEGKIQTKEYEKDGQKRTAVEILATSILFLGRPTRPHETPAENDGFSALPPLAAAADPDDYPF
jgi:single-strand DNA-binding protein